MFNLFNRNNVERESMKPNDEQAVILRSTFDSNEDFGTENEVDALKELESNLSEALEEKGFDCDGYEIGEGEFILYCYGSDADEMLSIVKQHIKDYPFAWYNITLRYGLVDNDDVEEKHIRINTTGEDPQEISVS